MTQITLLLLDKQEGSSRQEIWKCMQAKYPDADYKQFVTSLKKVPAQKSGCKKYGFIKKSKGGKIIQMESNFVEKVKGSYKDG